MTLHVKALGWERYTKAVLHSLVPDLNESMYDICIYACFVNLQYK